MDDKNTLLLQLHEQFSQNQNDTFSRYQNLFIALFALFGVFGVSFGVNTGLIKFGDFILSDTIFYFLSLLLIIVLCFLFCSLIYLGYQHRRDQFLNSKIRLYLLSQNIKKTEKSDDLFTYFFKGYQGTEKNILSFVPDNILLNIVLISILKVIVICSMVFVVSTSYAGDMDTTEYKYIKENINTDFKARPSNDGSRFNISTKIENCSQGQEKANFNQNISLDLNMFFISLTLIFIFIFSSVLFWFFQYKKYKKLENEYNKNDIKSLLELLDKIDKVPENESLIDSMKNLIKKILG